METDELITREHVRDLYTRYNRAGDQHHLYVLSRCFVPEGVLEAVNGFSVTGRDAIVERLGAVRRRGAENGETRRTLPVARHFVTALMFEDIAPDRVHSSAYFLVCIGSQVDHWGTYRDRVVRTDGGWLFEHRVVSVDGARPGSAAAALLEPPAVESERAPTP